MKQKFDIRAEVTGKIIAAIEAGTPPWRRPWTGATTACAFPLRSNGQAYRGINILMLWLVAAERGYSAAHWFTYKQAQGILLLYCRRNPAGGCAPDIHRFCQHE